MARKQFNVKLVKRGEGNAWTLVTIPFDEQRSLRRDCVESNKPSKPCLKGDDYEGRSGRARRHEQ